MTLTAQEIADGYSNNSPMSGKDTLDAIVVYCQHAGMFKPPHAISGINERQVVQVGNILFSANSHDTGCGVRAWILNDEGEVYEFISSTYWYSSQYTFNKSRWQKGAWDAAVAAAIAKMREAVAAGEAAREKRKADEEAAQIEAAAQRKAKFERQFVEPQS